DIVSESLRLFRPTFYRHCVGIAALIPTYILSTLCRNRCAYSDLHLVYIVSESLRLFRPTKIPTNRASQNIGV
ncbi:hypothetical protein WDW89_22140, partial [Deltaproteobacteria bacterium TL4]